MRDGWRVLMRAPGVILAEIIWRWTFGATMLVLLFISFREYFSSIEVSQAEYALMKSMEPFTWVAIAARVTQAFVSGVRDMGPVLVPALCLLWVGLATIGRAATVRSLAAEEGRTNWISLTALHVFRVGITFAALLAFFGAGAILSSFLDAEKNFGLLFLLNFAALLAISTIWSAVNWFLSVASMFASRDAAGVRDSMRGAADLYYSGAGRVGIRFALLRSVLVIVVTVASLMMTAAWVQGSGRAAVLGIAVITLVYFAIADALYVWRLAAYIGLTEPEIAIPSAEPLPPEPPETLESKLGLKAPFEEPAPTLEAAAPETSPSETAPPEPSEVLKADS